jgi:hypothetical protein
MATTVTPASAVQGDDAAIIRQSRQEPECFAAIFDRYYVQVHGYAARRLGGSLADDVAAEAFLVAFEGRNRDRTLNYRSCRWAVVSRMILIERCVD